MNRRALLTSFLAAGTGAAAPAKAAPKAVPAAVSAAVPKVAYHLSDPDKVQFVLGNIRNHIDGMGGPGNVAITLVVHGPPLSLLRADAGNKIVRNMVNRLAKEGVDFFACANTMRGMQLSLQDLLPGFVVAERGGVVKLAELQSQGWHYLRP